MGIKKHVALLASAILGLGVAAMAMPSAQALVFPLSNINAITIVDNAAASPSPSTISQFGMSTVITDVNVTLNGVSHGFPKDIDIELVSPAGSAVVLMSDACGGAHPLAATTLTFDDAAANSMPINPATACAGTYKPTNLVDADLDTWAVTPTGATLATFNGENPNSTNERAWQLFVRDDEAGVPGAITGGWSIQITTGVSAPITIPAFGSTGNGTAAPYPVQIPVTGQSGLITDVNVTIPQFAHTWPGDLSMVLVSPSGAKVKLMYSDCGNIDVLNKTFIFDDSGAAGPPSNCSAGGTYKPSTAFTLPSMPAPAPAGPFATTLAAFNGATANGTWSLFINDTGNNDGGWIGATPTLTFKTTDVIAPETSFTKKPKTGFKTTTKIKFASSEAGSHFECKVDTSKTFKPCTSPLKLKHLKYGKHKIQVRAIDAAGNVDPTPLRGKWKIIKKN
jgi:subtilisin-like proprotein convertase family protein